MGFLGGRVVKRCKTMSKSCQMFEKVAKGCKIFKNLAQMIEKLLDLAGVRAIIRTYKDGHLAMDRRGRLEHTSGAQTHTHFAFHARLVPLI